MDGNFKSACTNKQKAVKPKCVCGCRCQTHILTWGMHVVACHTTERGCGVVQVMPPAPPSALGCIGCAPSQLVVAQPVPTMSGDMSVGTDTSYDVGYACGGMPHTERACRAANWRAGRLGWPGHCPAGTRHSRGHVQCVDTKPRMLC